MYRYSLILAITALCALPAHCSIPVRPLMNHLRVIREFKQRYAKKRAPLRVTTQKPVRTQTEAYLAIPELKSRWQSTLEQHAALIDQIITREKEYASTHYIFYNGHSGDLRVAQDVLKELFILFNLPEHACDNFVFLRNWTKGSLQPDITSFFADIERRYGTTDFIDDHSNNFKPFLLSVNPCLLSNSYDIGECSFNYFMANWCHTSGLNILRELVDTFGLYNDTQLREYTRKFTRGQLLQICIPKELVDTYVYASEPFGKPRKQYHASHESQRLAMSALLQEFLNHTMDPNDMNRLQARILITPAILDPANDIHIHRYQLSLTSEQEAIYEQELKQIVHELVTQAYEIGTLKVPSGCNTQRLLRYIQGTPRY